MDNYTQGFIDKVAQVKPAPYSSRGWDYLAGGPVAGALREGEGHRFKGALKGLGGAVGGGLLGTIGGAGLGGLLKINPRLLAHIGGLIGGAEGGRMATLKKTSAYDQGFIDKCAKLDIDPKELLAKLTGKKEEVDPLAATKRTTGGGALAGGALGGAVGGRIGHFAATHRKVSPFAKVIRGGKRIPAGRFVKVKGNLKNTAAMTALLALMGALPGATAGALGGAAVGAPIDVGRAIGRKIKDK